MNNERKKIEKVLPPKVVPRKRGDVIDVIKQSDIDDLVNSSNKLVKPKRSEDKFIRLASDASQEEKREFGERVQKGELKIAYYAIDGDKSYHYYLKLK